MKQILSMVNFRKKTGYSQKEIKRLYRAGIIDIQHSGFKSDSNHHHKIVIFYKEDDYPQFIDLSNKIKQQEREMFIPNVKIVFVRNNLSRKTIFDFCLNCHEKNMVQAQPTVRVECPQEYCPDVYQEKGKILIKS